MVLNLWYNLSFQYHNMGKSYFTIFKEKCQPVDIGFRAENTAEKLYYNCLSWLVKLIQAKANFNNIITTSSLLRSHFTDKFF